MLALAAGLIAMPAQAAIYKCVDARGKVTYSDRGCSPSVHADRPQVQAPPAVPVLPPPATEKSAAPAVTPDASAVEGAAEIVTPASAADAPDAPLRPRKVQSTRWGLFGIGVALWLVAYLMHIVAAFRAGSTGWGIALILLSPLSNLFYVLFHWRQARAGALVTVAAVAICAVFYVRAVDLIDVTDAYVTARGSYDPGHRRPRLQFTRDETVYAKTVLDWDDPSVGTYHLVSWSWLTDGVVHEQFADALYFDDAPYTLLGEIPAATLGSGRHRVEVFIDGELMDAREFEIAP